MQQKIENQSGARTSLFRKEALEYKKLSYLGEVSVITPISFTILSLGVFSIAVALLFLVYFAQYTKKHEVIGILALDSGPVRIYTMRSGVVTKKLINQSDYVKKGESLYLISTEQDSLSGHGIFTEQIKFLESQIDLQKSRILSLQNKLKNYTKLLEGKLITETEHQKAYDDYLAAEIGLKDLEKSLIQARGEGNYVIRAPQDGAISALIANVGDRVTSDKLVAAIIPAGSKMQVELFIPQQTIGFIKLGQKVLLRYRAYPYQNFGLHESIIVNIDQSILSPSDINLPITLNESFYRAKVDLEDQSITAYGKTWPLIAGMLVDVTILTDSRSLWQWLIDPLYSI